MRRKFVDLELHEGSKEGRIYCNTLLNAARGFGELGLTLNFTTANLTREDNLLFITFQGFVDWKDAFEDVGLGHAKPPFTWKSPTEFGRKLRSLIVGLFSPFWFESSSGHLNVVQVARLDPQSKKHFVNLTLVFDISDKDLAKEIFSYFGQGFEREDLRYSSIAWSD